jgi:hypothetical protein
MQKASDTKNHHVKKEEVYSLHPATRENKKISLKIVHKLYRRFFTGRKFAHERPLKKSIQSIYSKTIDKTADTSTDISVYLCSIYPLETKKGPPERAF